MNPASVQSRLKHILTNGLPVPCKWHGRTLVGSYTQASSEVLLLEYGSMEDYRRSLVFAADSFPELPKRDDCIEVAGVPLFVLGVREEPGISVTVDLRK